MSEELKPCPFCGENEIAQTEVWSGFHRKWVNTRECKCCGAAAPTDAWNTRSELAALKAGQGEAVAFGHWAEGLPIGTRLMRYGGEPRVRAIANKFYNVPLYAAPPTPADARLVPVELLERVVSQFEDDCKSFSYDIDDIRALLAQSE